MAARWSEQVSLVGREHVRDRLQRLLDEASIGHARLALIYGEAGIGKTALVEDLGA